MNYLIQIKQFWQAHEAEQFSTDEIAFYLYLLETSNKIGWRNPFKRNNALVKADLRIKSFDKLCMVRNRLKSSGLIDFQTQNGNCNVEYELIDLSKNSEGFRQGIKGGDMKGLSEVLPELSKVKIENINKNKRVGESISANDFYEMFLGYFAENQEALKMMLGSTSLSKSTPEEIQAVILKFCEWYVNKGRVSPDFGKNKEALQRWFQNEKPTDKIVPISKRYNTNALHIKESKADQLRKTGLYE